jgi:formylmethanofuran dehydrogenase subunit C
VILELSYPVDCLCDFTYDFFWQHRGSRLSPSTVIPHQTSTSYTYQDLVFALKNGEDVNIKGNAGKRLGSSLGVDLKFFGGTGKKIKAGSIIIDGDVDTRMGISMICGAIYVKGNVKQPVGNVVEVGSARQGYRKFVSITDILSEVSNEKILPPNCMENSCLYIRDGIIRDTIAARLDADRKVIVEGDAGMSTGILMKRGFVRIDGDAGLNTAVLLRGGTIITGNSGEFAGAYMKDGVLIISGKAQGYVGANMKGGTIFYKGDAMVPCVPVDEKDIKMLIRVLDISKVEAMMFKRYGINKSI